MCISDWSSDVCSSDLDHLRAFIERIERLEEEKATLAADIREVFAEAKSSGFDPKIIRQVIKLRKMEPNDRQEQESRLDTSLHALGMARSDEQIVGKECVIAGKPRGEPSH